MRTEIVLDGDEFRHHLFVSSLPFTYRVTIGRTRRNKIITYSNPYEILLNLYAFRNDHVITCINTDNNYETFTITIETLKHLLTKTISNVGHDELELIYMKLLLTNRYSRAIIDKGHFRQYDSIMRTWLATLKGGYDCYLAYQNRKVILYLKYRRISSIHLLAVIQHWNFQNDIQINHISIPKTSSNQGLLLECLNVELTKDFFRIYSYNPLDEDNIQPIKIDSEIIQVINQLIK